MRSLQLWAFRPLSISVLAALVRFGAGPTKTAKPHTKLFTLLATTLNGFAERLTATVESTVHLWSSSTMFDLSIWQVLGGQF